MLVPLLRRRDAEREPASAGGDGGPPLPGHMSGRLKSSRRYWSTLLVKTPELFRWAKKRRAAPMVMRIAAIIPSV